MVYEGRHQALFEPLPNFDDVSNISKGVRVLAEWLGQFSVQGVFKLVDGFNVLMGPSHCEETDDEDH